MRVEPDEAEAWIANIQGDHSYTTKIVEWVRARSLIVIAQGACYLIRPDAPSEWRFVESLVTDCLLTPDHNLALVATYGDVVALSQEGKIMWRRSLGIDGVEIRQLTNDVAEGIACIDPPDEWVPFRIRTADGTDA